MNDMKQYAIEDINSILETTSNAVRAFENKYIKGKLKAGFQEYDKLVKQHPIALLTVHPIYAMTRSETEKLRMMAGRKFAEQTSSDYMGVRLIVASNAIEFLIECKFTSEKNSKCTQVTIDWLFGVCDPSNIEATQQLDAEVECIWSELVCTKERNNIEASMRKQPGSAHAQSTFKI